MKIRYFLAGGLLVFATVNHAQDIQTMAQAQQRIPSLSCNPVHDGYDCGSIDSKTKVNLVLHFDTAQKFVDAQAMGKPEYLQPLVQKVLQENASKPFTKDVIHSMTRWTFETMTAFYGADGNSYGGDVFVAVQNEHSAFFSDMWGFPVKVQQRADPVVTDNTPPLFTAFGIGFGVPLRLPECSYNPRVPGFYNLTQDRACYEKGSWAATMSDYNLIGDNRTDVQLVFPENDAPNIGSSWFAMIIDGNVEGLLVGTVGLSGKDIYLQRLKEKWGAPTTIDQKQVQTGGGATYDTFTAIWNGPNYTVNFLPLAGSVDKGQVQILTKRGAQVYDERAAALENKGRQL